MQINKEKFSKKKRGWYDIPKSLKKVSDLDCISERGTFSLGNNRYSRSYYIDDKNSNRALFRDRFFTTFRTEGIEFIFHVMESTTELECVLTLPFKLKKIDEEFDKAYLGWQAMLQVFDIQLVPISIDSRLNHVMSVFFDNWSLESEKGIYNQIENYFKYEKKLTKSSLIVYSLSEVNGNISFFLEELKNISCKKGCIIGFEPISNSIVRQNITANYALIDTLLPEIKGTDEEFYRFIKGDDSIENMFTNISYLLILKDSVENNTFAEKEISQICKHYNIYMRKENLMAGTIQKALSATWRYPQTYCRRYRSKVSSSFIPNIEQKGSYHEKGV